MSLRHEKTVSSGGMVKKRYDEKPEVFTLKVEPDLATEINAEVLYQSNQKGRIQTRSDVMKDLLREALAARRKKRLK